MSRWSDKFQEHPIHETLRQLNEWTSVDANDVEAEHEIEKRRLKKSISLITGIVGGLDPEFFPDELLLQLSQLLRQAAIWSNLNEYASNPTTQRLVEANDFLTTFIPRVYQLAALAREQNDRETVRALEEASDEFCAVLEKRDKKFEASLIEHQQKLTALEGITLSLTASHEALERDTEGALTTWQSEYTSAQTERAEVYSKSQIDRSHKFEEALRGWRSASETEIKEISNKHAEKMQTALDSYLSDADMRIADMKSKHEAILDIHGLVGTDGVAGGYQKGANDEHQAANLWRIISMAALLTAAVWILVKYWLGFDFTPTGTVNWAEIVTASSLTLVLLGAAGYAARQSTLHRETEQHMRWFALEVKAIDPFLSSLPIEQQNELKNQLSQKLFGQNRLTADKSEGSVDPVAFKSIMDAVSSMLKITGKG